MTARARTGYQTGNALLLWHLSAGPRRYGELHRLLPGVSSKVLAERLAWLDEAALPWT